MKAYKVLKKKDGKPLSPYKLHEFVLGEKQVCSDFCDDPAVDCAPGFYAGDLESLLYRGLWREYEAAFEVEVGGRFCNAGKFKHRYSEQTIVRELPREELWGMLKLEGERLGYDLAGALYPIDPLQVGFHPYHENNSRVLFETLSRWDSVRNSMRNYVGGPAWNSVRDSVRGSVWNSVWKSVRNSVWDSAWNSVGDSSGDSVWDSVWDSAWNSMGGFAWNSVRDSVWDSVRCSVWDSVWAHLSSLFPSIEKWRGIDHEVGINPFGSADNLWRSGYVPSFDGSIWRLHFGPKAEAVLEISAEDLRKQYPAK